MARPQRFRPSPLVAIAACLVLIGAAVLTVHSDGTRADGAALAGYGCPEPIALDLGGATARRQRAALSGRFEVMPGLRVRFDDPADWARDPIDSRSYRHHVQTLKFIRPLLAAYVRHHDRDALARALAVSLGWISANPPEAPAMDEAWIEKVVGDRSAYLAFVARAAACEHLVDAAGAARLVASLEQHAAFLADPANGSPTNHGLFVDRGLLVLARYLPDDPGADDWIELARRRFERTLRARLSNGFWLEHSTTYQLLALRGLDQFITLAGGDRELEAIRERMRAAASWFIEPDGATVQFGDSDRWSPQNLERAHGFGYFPAAGYAFVAARGARGPAYLAVTNGFHNVTHKHADELSFELFDGGRRIVTDTGMFHKDTSPERDFALSAQAHSTLTADGRSFPITDPALAYGSGIAGAGRGAGWYAIAGSNPLLETQGISHRRLFLYRPGVALVVVDRLDSDELHSYRRSIQLDPALEASAGPGAGAIGLDAPGFRGEVYDAPVAGTEEPSLVRGQADPLQGMTSPDFRRWQPRWTLGLASTGGTATYTTTVGIGARPNRAVAARWVRGGAEVTIRRSDGSQFRLQVTRSGRALNIERAAA